jgi:hypothetical protein
MKYFTVNKPYSISRFKKVIFLKKILTDENSCVTLISRGKRFPDFLLKGETGARSNYSRYSP